MKPMAAQSLMFEIASPQSRNMPHNTVYKLAWLHLSVLLLVPC